MITDEMVEKAALVAWLSGGLNTIHDWHAAESVERVQYLREARVVLEYAATLGPSREERLTRYRCAMLAAVVGTDERPYSDTAREIEMRAREQDDAAARSDEAETADAEGNISWREAFEMLQKKRPATETPDTSVEHVARLALAEAELAVLRELTAAQERALTRLRDALRRELDEGDLEACGPRDDLRALLPTKETPNPMPGSLSDQVAAYLDAGNESAVEHIAEQLHSNPVDVLAALTDLHCKGKADIVDGSRRWAKVPR